MAAQYHSLQVVDIVRKEKSHFFLFVLKNYIDVVFQSILR